MTAIAPRREDDALLKPRRDPFLIILWIILVTFALVWIAPVVLIAFTALKSNAEVMATSAFTPPQEIAWNNFSGAWACGNFETTFKNSVIITVIKVPLGLMFSAMAAYALARIRLRFGKLLLLFFLFGAMIPF